MIYSKQSKRAKTHAMKLFERFLQQSSSSSNEKEHVKASCYKPRLHLSLKQIRTYLMQIESSRICVSFHNKYVKQTMYYSVVRFQVLAHTSTKITCLLRCTICRLLEDLPTFQRSLIFPSSSSRHDFCSLLAKFSNTTTPSFLCFEHFDMSRYRKS